MATTTAAKNNVIHSDLGRFNWKPPAFGNGNIDFTQEQIAGRGPAPQIYQPVFTYHGARRFSFDMVKLVVLMVALVCCAAAPVLAQEVHAPTDVKAGSITYEEIPYPYPVQFLPLTLYGQDVRLAYMDVPPSGQANGRTAVLFHGMNFGGFYFSGPIELLRKEGFRVVVPDQIGFGRSSKPIIPYNFHDMAANSRKLLQTLAISKVAVIGHSM